jgi:hypothetical protein
MYLKRYRLDNDGPITKLDITLPFRAGLPYETQGIPIPVIAVGASGSGKSIFLSRIIDALTEINKQVFDDAVPLVGNTNPYLRVVSPNQISFNNKYLAAQLEFATSSESFRFIEIVGDFNQFPDRAEYASWGDPKNLTMTKRINILEADKPKLRDELKRSVTAYFPSNRNELPHWLNTPGVQREATFVMRADFINVLQKPLYLETLSEKTKSWVLDVALDTFATHNKYISSDLQLVNKILQIILRDEKAFIKFDTQSSGARLGIQTSKGRLNSIDHLSSAESILFNLFTTIVRYAQKYQTGVVMGAAANDLFEGIVIVDEVDAHLHSELQFYVLPKLIAMFPHIQFIMTTHSPLFLMGMEKEFGENGIRILELPEGRLISSERFTEFGVSLQLYSETKAFEDNIIARLQKGNKPLVCTEGETDATYINAAIDILGFPKLKNAVEVVSIGKKTGKGSEGSGSSALETARKLHLNNPLLFARRIVLLYDSDEKKAPETMPDFFVRSVPLNVKNVSVTKGIENLLPEELFEEKFYDVKEAPTGYGRNKILPDLKKVDLCTWVCSQRRVEDFENFRPLLESLELLLVT